AGSAAAPGSPPPTPPADRRRRAGPLPGTRAPGPGRRVVDAVAVWEPDPTQISGGSVTDRYADFPHLRFDRPADRVLRITLDGPGLNAVDHAVRRELADVWRAVDRDPETHVAVLQGAGKAF